MRNQLEAWMASVERETDGKMRLTITIDRDGIRTRVHTLHDRKSLAHDQMTTWKEFDADTRHCEARIGNSIEHIRREMEWLDDAPACNR